MKMGSAGGFGQSGGGGFGMDPLTLGLGVVGAGFSLFGANKTANAQRDAAAQQAAAAKYAADAQAAAGRDVAKANMFQTMFGANFASREKDLDIGRQFEVAKLQAGPLADMFRESARKDAFADFGFRTRGDVREETQRQNRDRLKASVAERQAQMAGMFGRIAPINVDTLAV